MPPPIQIPDDTLISYLIILLFTLMGAAARVFYNWMTGNPVSFVFTIGQIIISIFANSLTLMIVVRLGWKIYDISVACGLAAGIGINILDFFEKRLLERLEGNKK